MPGVLASLIDRFGFELAAVGAGVLGLLCATVMVLVARNARLRAAATEERELTRFWLLADATFSGVFGYRDNVILDVNAALCRFMGCAAADLVGHQVGGQDLTQVAQVDGARGAEPGRDDNRFPGRATLRLGDHVVRETGDPVGLGAASHGSFPSWSAGPPRRRPDRSSLPDLRARPLHPCGQPGPSPGPCG